MSLGVVVEGTSGKREARTSDISLGGCYIDAMHQVFDGETLTLRFHLPGDEWVAVKGIVVYNQYPTGFGVRFTDVPEESLNGLDKTISDYLVKHAKGAITPTSDTPPETSID